jgi:hypothetical protein
MAGGVPAGDRRVDLPDDRLQRDGGELLGAGRLLGCDLLGQVMI